MGWGERVRIRRLSSRAICTAFALLIAVPVLAPATRAAAATSPTTVSFTFDNQWSSQLTAAAALHAHGMAGTFYVISGWIGQTGFMSLSDLQTLAAQGQEIGGKTVNNSDLPTLSDAEAEREICQGRNVLLADGFPVTDFAYPFADLNATDETLVKACGFNSGRGVGDLNSLDPGGCLFPDCPYAESIPPADPYKTLTPDDGESNTTLAEMEGDVTDANNNGGGWLQFSFHQICDVTTPGCDPIYSVSPTLFNQFLDWLQTQSANGVTVKTVQQVIGGAVQPAVTAPTVPPAPIGTNALVNPTLTTADTITPTNPACWSQDTFGTNSPTFAWSTTGGEGGGGQETVTMNNRVSGDAKLLTTFDLGQCSPTSVVGDTYSLSTYYKSTVPVFFTVYGRVADGTWSYWTQSPTFPASAGVSLATWRTPAVPATVQALSYGLTIDSNGTLTTSNYSLVDQGSGVPPAAPVGVNALANPLLQTPDGSGSNPVCWSPSGFGTNTPSFTWSSTGGQTGGQETINMTSWTSGDAKLLTPFDNGNCAPTVTAGHVYNLGVYYQSSVPVFITLYSRDTTGTWGYWTQSQPFPATNTWTLATFASPVVPANINGASFGMTLASVGNVSTSNYSLIDTGPPVVLAPQSISFTGPGTGGVGGTATLSATGGGSGNPVVFSVDPTSDAGVCTLAGATVTYLKVGNCVIAANQAASSTFAAAPGVSQTIVVGPGSVVANVSGSTTYSASTETFANTNNAPSGVTVSGTLTCTTVNGGTAINAALNAGSYTVDASSCTGLTLSDPVSYVLSYLGVAGGFVVNPAAQAITFTAPGPAVVGGTATLSATGGVSGNPVVFSADATSGPGVCTVSGTTATYTGVGNCVIDANQAGTTNYAAAPQVSQTVAVGPSHVAQTITFGALAAQTLAQTPVTVTATATSALPVTFTTTTPAVCSESGTNGATIGLLTAGTCTVSANQTGNATYDPAPTVSQSFTVSKAAQTITFAAQTAKTLAQSPVTVTATATSALAVTFTTSTPTVCTSSGTNGAMITLLATGTCTVSANQIGNTVYNAAPAVTRSFAVTKAAQTITFAALTAKPLGAPVVVSATASSGLPVTFTTTTPAVCAWGGTNGSTITLLATGTCTVSASQVGNTIYNAAPVVNRNFTVQKTAQTITFTPLSDQVITAGSITVSATASSGLPVTFTTTTPARCTPGGTNGATITLLAAGSCNVRATQAGDATYAAAAAVPQAFTISKAAQTITFAALPARTLAQSPVTVQATTSSGLPVTFTSTTTGRCTASGTNGSTITLLRTGTCTVRASSPATTVYTAAPVVTQSFTIS